MSSDVISILEDIRDMAECGNRHGGAAVVFQDDAKALLAHLTVWRKPEEALPDPDIEVMVATDNGEVLPAFHDDECWRDLTAMPISAQVTHWTDYPKHPTEA